MDLTTFFSDPGNMLAQVLPRSTKTSVLLSEGLRPVRTDPVQLRRILFSLVRVIGSGMSHGDVLTIRCHNLEQASLTNPSKTRNVTEKYVQILLQAEEAKVTKEASGGGNEPAGTAELEASATAAILKEVNETMNENGSWLEVEQRTTFRLVLPTSNSGHHSHSHPYQEPHRKVDSPGEPPVRRILVVDDEPALRKMATRVLESCGYQIVTASNGQEAVNLFAAEKQTIDLILLDLGMPVMSGQEALVALRALDPNVRVVITSGEVTEEDEPILVGLGAKAVVPKPYQLNQLLGVIRQVLV
ncbi:MAG: response regulator [Gemmataceae bacterium]